MPKIRVSTQASSASEPRPALQQVDDTCWRIDRASRPDMRVDGLIYASPKLIEHILQDEAVDQVANVACLPGIQLASLAMPDIHWGYGFCIGGVCATDPEQDGVISPGGVGYDINCGVRLLRSNLELPEIKRHVKTLVHTLFSQIPTGAGRTGRYHFTPTDLHDLMAHGSQALLRRGLATDRDIACTEARGQLPGAEPDSVSPHAVARGQDQCGTLGSGNHFIEVQVVDRIVDPQAAAAMGLEEGMICVMIHSGSRGLGYQVCDDELRALRGVPEGYGITLPDRQLACAPIQSPEGERYLGAMRAAANFAWCNRQLLMWQVREVFQTVLGRPWEDLGLQLIYDVCHNVAKFEEHRVGGQLKRLCVHRKGATRAFPPGHPEVPAQYREVGQPVIIPGDMGRASWVLVGQQAAMDKTFGTTCHGAGRALSRTAAARDAAHRNIAVELARCGIVALAQTRRGLAEEQPAAYKDVDDVVEVVHQAGLSKKVARLKPIGVIKG